METATILWVNKWKWADLPCNVSVLQREPVHRTCYLWNETKMWSMKIRQIHTCGRRVPFAANIFWLNLLHNWNQRDTNGNIWQYVNLATNAILKYYGLQWRLFTDFGPGPEDVQKDDNMKVVESMSKYLPKQTKMPKATSYSRWAPKQIYLKNLQTNKQQTNNWQLPG